VAEAYNELRKKLIGLTDVTREYFAKLVAQLETGFDRMGEVRGLPRLGPPGAAEAPGERACLGVRRCWSPLLRLPPPWCSRSGHDGGAAPAAPSHTPPPPPPPPPLQTYAAEQPGSSSQHAEQQQQQGQAEEEAAQQAPAQAGGSGKGAKRSRGGERGAAAAGGEAALDPLLLQQGFWTCGVCTFNNTDLVAQSCGMCQEPRQA
jgi:hypothetical protein